MFHFTLFSNLHFLQILFHFLQFSPNFVLNYKNVQILIFKTVQIPFNFQVSPFFFFFTFKIVQIFNCKTVPNFTNLHFSPFFQIQSKATQAVPGPRGVFQLVQMHMWQPIKGHHCTVSETFFSRATSTNRINFLSPFSYRSNPTNSPKSFKNIHGTLAQSEAIPATIHTKFIQILRIHHQVQLTEINRSRIHTNSVEFHTVLRDSEGIFIIEPRTTAIRTRARRGKQRATSVIAG